MSPPGNGKRPGCPPKRSPQDQVATTPPLPGLEDSATRPQIAREWDNRRLAERRSAPIPKRRSEAGAVVWVEIGRRNSAQLLGQRLVPVLKLLGVPYQWHPYRQDWLCCPANRVDDVIAYLEHRHRRVAVVAVDR